MENIIFLPGLGCDHRLFSHQKNRLKNEYKIEIIVCDAKDSIVDHIKFVLDQSPEKFILVGHSFGGWIAQWIAIEAPERISNLILMGTGTGKLTSDLERFFTDMKLCFEQEKASAFFQKINPLIVQNERKNDQPLFDLIKTMQDSFSKERLLNQVNTDLEARHTNEFLSKIRAKTLLIHGKHDSFYKNDMLTLKELIPDNHYLEIENSGHMLPIEQPEAVTCIIKLWLDLVKIS